MSNRYVPAASLSRYNTDPFRRRKLTVHWHLIHTKPRQEKNALENLERQGFPCYLPMLREEKLLNGVNTLVDVPLFPLYLSIRLGHGLTAKAWSPIRSTRGVSQLVSFGNSPVKAPDELIEQLQSREKELRIDHKKLFASGDRVSFIDGALAGVDGLYQIPDGEKRALILIELLSKPLLVKAPVKDLRKLG